MSLCLRGPGTGVRRSLAATFALALFALPTLPGCSLMGYGLGSATDTARARRDVRRIEPGTKVEVRLRAGQTLRGVFIGTATLPFEEYETRYDRWRQDTRTVPRPPALGDAIELALTTGGIESGRFAGLTTGQVVLADEDGNERAIATRLLAGPWGETTRISATAFGSALSRAPRRDAILLSTPEGNRVVAAEEIRMAGLPRRSTGRWAGTLIGVAADALIVGVLVGLGSSAPLFSFQ